MFLDLYITLALVVYLSSLLSSQAILGFKKQIRRKMPFICSITKGSVYSSYATEIIYWFYFPATTTYLIFLMMRQIPRTILKRSKLKTKKMTKVCLKERLMVMYGNAEGMSTHLAFRGGQELLLSILDAWWHFKNIIVSDTAISSINNHPKILPNHQQLWPPKRGFGCLSQLYYGNSFDIVKRHFWYISSNSWNQQLFPISIKVSICIYLKMSYLI